MTNTLTSSRIAAGLVAVVLSITGCYTSPVPLADPTSAAVDSTFVGSWEAVVSSENQAGTLNVFPFNEHEYLVEMVADTVVNGIRFETERERLRVFTTPVGGLLFANAQWIDDPDEQDFMFHRVELRNDTLVLRTVATTLFSTGRGWETRTFATSDSLRDALEAKLGEEELYDSSVLTFVRKRDGS